MSYIKLKGMKKLEKQLKSNCTLNDVKTVVKMDGAYMQKQMQLNASPSVAFKKGYSQGDTKKHIFAPELSNGGLVATVGPTTNYSPYVEYGTRFMEPEPFVKPAFDAASAKFEEHLKKLMR